MSFDVTEKNLPSDFRVKSTLGVGIAGLFLLAPFSINNFLQGRNLLGFGSLAIVILLLAGAWGTRKGRYYPVLTFVGLVPAVLVFIIISFQKQGIIAALWCYPAVLAFYMLLPERLAWVTNACILLIVIPKSWELIDPGLASRISATLMAVSAFSAIFIRVISVQQKLLQTQALTDALTGLPNRIQLNHSLEQAVEQHNRLRIPMTLITVDLDNFKQINDTRGHDAGDVVLRGLGQLFQKRFRRSDQIFRLGGEEFLLLLHSVDSENAGRIAEDLRRAIETYPFLPDGQVTASLGVATLRPDEDWQAWMKRSDDYMYRAKASGRNCIIVNEDNS